MKFKKTTICLLLIFFVAGSLKAQLTKIPFEFKGSHIYINLQIGKSDTLRFIFDTGCTGAMIDSAAAEKAGIMNQGKKDVSVAGSGGTQLYRMVEHKDVNLKGLKISDINLVTANLNSLSTDLGTKIDGIIGYEILNRYITKLDFEHKELSLYARTESIDTTGYTGIPFEFNKNVLIPRFPISITLSNGDAYTGRVMFDTGNASTLLVSAPFSKYHDFNSKLGATSITKGRGMSSFTQDQLANIKSMSFNDFNFGAMGIRLTVNEQAEPKGGYLGILGMPVIKRFNVILDYEHKKIYLKPNKNYDDPFTLEKIPLKLTQESKNFLEKNKTKKGINVTASGLQYKILKAGKGAVPTMQDRVSMHFSAKVFNGQQLWNTREDNKPWIHHLDKALVGVKEAALMMPVGSKWELYIPSSLAFGDAGFEEVPGGAALVYEVEILDIIK